MLRRWLSISLFLLGVTILIFIIGLKNKNSEPESSYWVWRSSDMLLVPNDAPVVLYQGNINTNWQYRPLGIRPVSLMQTDVRLLIRIYALGSQQDIADLYQSLKNRWAYFGVNVTGLEIDFDCASSLLIDYANWLQVLDTLVEDTLSVTSLMTYINDHPKGLLAVSRQVDHISMQLYADYYANPHFEKVPSWLKKNKVKHRLGVSRAPEFDQASAMCNNYCLGTQIFLNKKGTP